MLLVLAKTWTPRAIFAKLGVATVAYTFGRWLYAQLLARRHSGVSRGPLGVPLLGHALLLDPKKLIKSMAALPLKHGTFWFQNPVTASAILTADPELAKDIFHSADWAKVKILPSLIKHFDCFTGDGLFSAEDNNPAYARAHRIIGPFFRDAKMQNYAQIFKAKAELLSERWFVQTGAFSPFDDVSNLTLDALGVCIFGREFDSIRGKAPSFLGAFREVQDVVNKVAENPLRIKQKLLELSAAKLKQEIAEIYREAAANFNASNKDLLSQMLSNEDKLSYQVAMDNLITMLLAGHDTTAALLHGVLFYMGQHPEMQDRLREEVRGLTQTDDVEAVMSARYLDSVIKEVLRLHPPSPLQFRTSVVDGARLGKHIRVPRKHTTVVWMTEAVHRDPAYWDAPDTFRPERWLNASHEGHYFPFAEGRRKCIGYKFAELEAKVVLATLFRDLRFQSKQTWSEEESDVLVQFVIRLKDFELSCFHA